MRTRGNNINIRMDDLFASELQRAAKSEQRSRSELIRHILRLEMARRGLLDFHAKPAPIRTARQMAKDSSTTMELVRG